MQKEELYRIMNGYTDLSKESAVELKELTEKYPWFSMAWVAYLKNLKLIESPEYNSVLGKAAIRVPNRKLLHHYLNSENTSKPLAAGLEDTLEDPKETKENAKTEEPSLIDKFLASNPGLIRRKLDDDSTVEPDITKVILEKSSTESDELITETLANIYFKQKNFEKALHAYQKLSLKYPEKSVYFASRIKEIEDILNNN